MLADRGEATPAFGIVLLKAGNELSLEQGVYEVGTATRIVSRRTRRSGRSDIVVEGLQRFEILSINWEMGYGLATIQWREELIGDRERLEQAMTPAIAQFQRYVRGVTQVTGRQFQGVRMSEDPIAASYDLASRLPLHTWERQHLLSVDRADERFELLLKVVRREVALLIKSGAAGLAINHPGQRFTLN
ncbi:MAG: LON peptidase substrate-binding domain-containing protein [Thermomicrobiales bacterium]